MMRNDRKDSHMKLIGITGGVGAGKSRLLSYIEENCNCRILLADNAAHTVEEPGQPCYGRLVELLGADILRPDGYIDKQKMAAAIFAEEELLTKVNGIIHPAVKEYILSEIRKERAEGKKDAFFVEAALLIEDGYEQILDELWYIHADSGVRRQRLKASRGYSEEKVAQIIASQLSEEEYRKHCKVVIDNSGSLSDTYMQIDERLKEAGLKE